jgi:hypothetical protein
MPLEVNGRLHRKADVMVSGDSEFLLVTVHDKENDEMVHCAFSRKTGFEVEQVF